MYNLESASWIQQIGQSSRTEDHSKEGVSDLTETSPTPYHEL